MALHKHKRKATPKTARRKLANIRLTGKRIPPKILTKKEMRQLRSEARLEKLREVVKRRR